MAEISRKVSKGTWKGLQHKCFLHEKLQKTKTKNFARKKNYFAMPIPIPTSMPMLMPRCRWRGFQMTLGEGVLKICSKFTREYSCRSAISIKLLSNFIEITPRHGCFPVNLLYIFKIPFSKNNSEWLLVCVLDTNIKIE